MISVCIPTYNGEIYIKEQLDSILPQLSFNDEIIISDDLSTDKTLSIIHDIEDPRIKIFTHQKVNNPYIGPYKNIYYVYKNVENAIQHASGDYIFLSDQDDIWLPNKINRIMQAFNEGADCILHNNKVIDNEYNILLESYFNFTRPSLNLIKIIAKCPFQGASMAFTKKIACQSLPFPNNPISHDHWIAYNAYFRNKKITLIQEPLMLYRRHGNNVSPSSEKSTNPLWFKISYRILLIRAAIQISIQQNNPLK